MAETSTADEDEPSNPEDEMSAFAVTEATTIGFILFFAMAMLINGKQNALNSGDNGLIMSAVAQANCSHQLTQLTAWTVDARREMTRECEPGLLIIIYLSMANWIHKWFAENGGPMTSFVKSSSDAFSSSFTSSRTSGVPNWAWAPCSWIV